MKVQHAPNKPRRGARTTLRALVAALVLMIALPALAGPPTDFVKKKSDDLFAIVNQPVGKARTDAMRAEVRKLIDYNQLAQRSLGAEWKKLNPHGQAQFTGLLETIVELNYANRFKEKSAGKDYKPEYSDEKVRGNVAIVKTKVTYDGETFSIDYKVNMSTKEPTIFDAVFDDVSLEETYRTAYVPLIQKEGWTGMFKRMTDKCKELGGSADSCSLKCKETGAAGAEACIL